MARVSFFALTARRPGSLFGIDGVKRSGNIIIPADAVEYEEFILRPEKRRVRNAR